MIHVDMLTLLQNMQPRIIESSSINIGEHVQLKQRYQALSQDTKLIFDYVFNDKKNKINLIEFLPFKLTVTLMPVCNKLFLPNERIYRCFDCITHEAAVFCKGCFQRGNHTGHRYEQILSGGGNCDCGNPDAIVPQGFCTQHTGQAQQYNIAEQEINLFVKYLGEIFHWVRILRYTDGKQNAVILANIIVNYLGNLNQSSLYYNTLTYELLFGSRARPASFGRQLVDMLFEMGVNYHQLGQKVTEVYLKIFSLVDFKYELTLGFIRNYNRIEHFEESPFQSLFVQLYANNDIIERVLRSKDIGQPHDIILDPFNRIYNPSIYYHHLSFLGSVHQRSSRIFFRQLMFKHGFLDCNYLNIIQKEIEQGNQNSVALISQHIQQQNDYIGVMKIIVKKLSDRQQIIDHMIRSYFDVIVSSKKFSFKKNKIILHPHRVIGLLLLARFSGDIEAVDHRILLQILQVDVQKLKEWLITIMLHIVNCIGELCISMRRTSYFSNYVPLYLQSGHLLIRYDLLTLKICAILMDRMGDCMAFANAIMRHYEYSRTVIVKEAQFGKEFQNIPIQAYSDFIEKWRIMLSFFAQVAYSNRYEVDACSYLGYNTTTHIAEKTELFKSIMLTLKQISEDQFEIIKRFFFSDSQDKEFISQIVTFDKQKKKLVLRENIQGFPLIPDYLLSLQKTMCQGIFKDKKPIVTVLQQTPRLIMVRAVLLNDHMLRYILQNEKQLIDSLPNQNGAMLVIHLASDLDRLRCLYPSSNGPIQQCATSLLSRWQSDEQMNKKLTSIFMRSFENSQLQKQQESQRRKAMKAKRDLKLQKLNIKQKQQKMLQHHKIETQEREDEHTCIICRNTSLTSPLCYLAQVKYSNLFFRTLGQEQKSLYITSCCHVIHSECYKPNQQGKSTLCPLCKRQANFPFPINFKQISLEGQKNLFTKFLNLIQPMSASEQNIFTSFMLYFVQFFGLLCLRKRPCKPNEVVFAKTVLQFFQFISPQMIAEDPEIFEQILDTLKQQHSSFPFQHFVLTNIYEWIETRNINFACATKYLTHVSFDDLTTVIRVLCEVTNTKLPELLRVQYSQPPISLKDSVRRVLPPKTVMEMFAWRDAKSECKAHSLYACLFCEWAGCVNCGKVKEHVRQQHYTTGVFLNCNLGVLLLIDSSIFEQKTLLYSDEMGSKWTPIKKPNGFKLDEEEYEQVMQYAYSETLQSYMRR